MVAGLIRPTSGTVSVAGRNVADLGDKALSVLRNRTIGFVTQSQTLLGNLTVLDNVILPATMFPEPLPFAQNAEATDAVAQAAATNDEAAADSAADPFMPDVIAPITDQENTPSNTAASRSDLFATRARTLLTQLGVADTADSYPRELSGGEMRRVSIARALMNQPSFAHRRRADRRPRPREHRHRNASAQRPSQQRHGDSHGHPRTRPMHSNTQIGCIAWTPECCP